MFAKLAFKERISQSKYFNEMSIQDVADWSWGRRMGGVYFWQNYFYCICYISQTKKKSLWKPFSLKFLTYLCVLDFYCFYFSKWHLRHSGRYCTYLGVRKKKIWKVSEAIKQKLSFRHLGEAMRFKMWLRTKKPETYVWIIFDKPSTTQVFSLLMIFLTFSFL